MPPGNPTLSLQTPGYTTPASVLSCDVRFLSLEFSRQKYWSGLPFSSPGDLSNAGSNPCFLHLLHWQADSLPLAPVGKPHKVKMKSLSRVRLFATPWAVAYQTPLSTGFSRQEY